MKAMKTVSDIIRLTLLSLATAGCSYTRVAPGRYCDQQTPCPAYSSGVYTVCDYEHNSCVFSATPFDMSADVTDLLASDGGRGE